MADKRVVNKINDWLLSKRHIPTYIIGLVPKLVKQVNVNLYIVGKGCNWERSKSRLNIKTLIVEAGKTYRCGFYDGQWQEVK